MGTSMVQSHRLCRTRNVDRLTRVYGPTTWDLYERLDVSLDPSGPDSLYQIAKQYLT